MIILFLAVSFLILYIFKFCFQDHHVNLFLSHKLSVTHVLFFSDCHTHSNIFFLKKESCDNYMCLSFIFQTQFPFYTIPAQMILACHLTVFVAVLTTEYRVLFSSVQQMVLISSWRSLI